MNIEQFYRGILEGLPQIIIVGTPLPEQAGETDVLIDYVNPAWEHIVGVPRETIMGKMFSQTIFKNSPIPWLDFAIHVNETKQGLQQLLFSERLDKWLDITVFYLEPDHICVHFSDVTEQKNDKLHIKKQNVKLTNLAAELEASKTNLKVKLEKIQNLNDNLEQFINYDRLTKLPNRLRFSAILADELEYARRTNNKLAVAILDIDNLKILNDTKGHDAGDALLCQIAQRLLEFKTDSIHFSRFGGDEFLILLSGYEHDAELHYTITMIQEALRKPYYILHEERQATVSIGIATYPEDAATVSELLRFADLAMTEAKRKGKNTLAMFHLVMQENLIARLNMEQKMFKALDDEIFQLFFQPQYEVTSNRLRGFEALIRWFDFDLGAIQPDTFIPVAEENKIIIPLGYWILRTACRTLSEWQTRYGFRGIMSVNISPIQLQHEDFLQNLKAIIAETQIPPESLEIEITEGFLIHNFEKSVKLLQDISSFGVCISLDDFGTGYSSLRYLQLLPLNTLKIDKSFIANIAKEASIEYDITDAIVSLMTKLGLDTIAEGVETDEQLAAIQQLNCKTIQGYLTGRPMTKGDCEKLFIEATGIHNMRPARP
ncbi:EAL domain-containing protein [Brucepastera parasyntrophica]|uniref:sensor domain-containing protein n=1 Tax=Brucepastera parasyntrophica TaxID=2880008 RepID=UPI002109457C|nr:EAL domain-containing protein [Brucepastera parasyntrophica]ULQ60627.1 EAL domain-containing protein [Brucepastera parasyntrophica]